MKFFLGHWFAWSLMALGFLALAATGLIAAVTDWSRYWPAVLISGAFTGAGIVILTLGFRINRIVDANRT
jgi:hypothetical protein